MSTIFTIPGKLGDAILQWPVAYYWANKNAKQITVWLDEKMLGPLKTLIEAQPCVEAVKMIPGIKTYDCGGQPWHFDLKPDDMVGHTVNHLGFRRFPERQITMQTALDIGFHVDTEVVAQEASLFVEPYEPTNRLVLHGTFQSHHTGVPGFWRVLHDHWDLLRRTFDDIVFTGTPPERERALELYPACRDFDDHGEFLETAKLMAGARMVMGSGSSGVTLAGALKVPCIRVHDPMGDAPKAIWANLGDNQINETEITLRRALPEFVEKWCDARLSV